MLDIKTSIGGQALLEGIMMRGPKKTSMAVRDPQGNIVIEEFPTAVSTRAKITKLPFIRGIFNMVDSLRVGYKCLMRSAEISGLDDDDGSDKAEKQNKLFKTVMLPLAAVLGIVLAVGLFMYLPALLYKLLSGVIPALSGNRVLQSVFEGVFRIVIFVAYIAAVSLMKDMRRVFAYHGAEHKSIFCYESGKELTVENIRPMRRFHPRCGTSFVILVLLVGIIIAMFIPASVPTLARVGIKLLCLPLVVGIGYELIKFAGKHDNILTRIVSAPGMWLQHLTTKEPDDSMIECAITALTRVIPEDGSDRI